MLTQKVFLVSYVERSRKRWLNVCILCMLWAQLLSRVQLFAIQWTVAHQVLLSLGILQARILEWAAMPSPRGSSQPRVQTRVSHIAGGWILYHLSHQGSPILQCFTFFLRSFSWRTPYLSKYLILSLVNLSPVHHLYFPTTIYYQWFHFIPLPTQVLINLPEWLTGLRETFYLLSYWFVIKEYNTGTVRYKARYGGRSQSFHKIQRKGCCLQACQSPQISIYSPTEKLSHPCPVEFLWNLHHMGRIN